MLFPKPASAEAKTPVTVVYFANPDWGFGDAALPKLQAFLRRHPSLRCRITHASLTAYFDAENEGDFQLFIEELQALAADPDFADFKIGAAEGFVESPLDIASLELAAFRKLKQSEN